MEDENECIDISVGRSFDTYDDFLACIGLRENRLGERWVKDSGGKTVESANQNIKDPARHYKTTWRYQYVNFKCIHGGTFKSRAKSRKSKSLKMGCPTHIQLASNRKKNALIVTKVKIEHNHELTPPSFGLYAIDRKPTQQEQEEVMNLKCLGMTCGRIRSYMSQNFGKSFTREDINNMARRALLQSSPKVNEGWRIPAGLLKENSVNSLSESCLDEPDFPEVSMTLSEVPGHKQPTRDERLQVASKLMEELMNVMVNCTQFTFERRCKVLKALLEAWRSELRESFSRQSDESLARKSKDVSDHRPQGNKIGISPNNKTEVLVGRGDQKLVGSLDGSHRIIKQEGSQNRIVVPTEGQNKNVLEDDTNQHKIIIGSGDLLEGIVQSSGIVVDGKELLNARLDGNRLVLVDNENLLRSEGDVTSDSLCLDLFNNGCTFQVISEDGSTKVTTDKLEQFITVLSEDNKAIVNSCGSDSVQVINLMSGDKQESVKKEDTEEEIIVVVEGDEFPSDLTDHEIVVCSGYVDADDTITVVREEEGMMGDDCDQEVVDSSGNVVGKVVFHKGLESTAVGTSIVVDSGESSSLVVNSCQQNSDVSRDLSGSRMSISSVGCTEVNSRKTTSRVQTTGHLSVTVDSANTGSNETNVAKKRKLDTADESSGQQSS